MNLLNVAFVALTPNLFLQHKYRVAFPLWLLWRAPCLNLEVWGHSISPEMAGAITERCTAEKWGENSPKILRTRAKKRESWPFQPHFWQQQLDLRQVRNIISIPSENMHCWLSSFFQPSLSLVILIFNWEFHVPLLLLLEYLKSTLSMFHYCATALWAFLLLWSTIDLGLD